MRLLLERCTSGVSERAGIWLLAAFVRRGVGYPKSWAMRAPVCCPSALCRLAETVLSAAAKRAAAAPQLRTAGRTLTSASLRRPAEKSAPAGSPELSGTVSFEEHRRGTPSGSAMDRRPELSMTSASAGGGGGGGLFSPDSVSGGVGGGRGAGSAPASPELRRLRERVLADSEPEKVLGLVDGAST
jgi:hypothetical protein